MSEHIQKAIVGCVLEKPELAEELEPTWFEDLRYEAVIAAVNRLSAAGKPTDLITVHMEVNLPSVPIGFLAECVNSVASPESFSYWRDQLTEAANKSRLSAAANHFLASLPTANGNIRDLVSSLEDQLASPITKERRVLTSDESSNQLIDRLEIAYELKGKPSGILTGFYRLDRILDGLQYGEMTLVGARPSAGKTALACNIIQRACIQDKIPTLVLSLEMTASSLLRRILSSMHSIPMGDLKSGELSNEQMQAIAVFTSNVKKSPLFIRESCGGMSASEASSLIRRYARKHGVKLVILDYLQKLRSSERHEKRTYEIGEASNTLIAAIKDSNVASVILGQLNRESEKDKGRLPRLSDIADSGQIERDADSVILLHRDKAKDSQAAKLILAKQRDGETGLVELLFQGEFCRFVNPEYQS